MVFSRWRNKFPDTAKAVQPVHHDEPPGNFILRDGVARALKTAGGQLEMLAQSIANRGLTRGDDVSRSLAFMTSVAVYRAVTTISNTVNAIPYHVKVNGKPVPAHLLTLAIEQNIRFNDMPLFQQWAGDAQIFGECYLEHVRMPVEMGGELVALRRLNPLYVEPDIRGGEITGFSYSGADKFHHFKPYEVTMFKTYPRPDNDLRGMAPLDVALDDVNSDRDVKRATAAYFRNYSAPDGIITTRDPNVVIPDTTREKFKREWNEQFQGASKRGKVAFLTGALTYQKIGQTPTDAEAELRTQVNRAIYRAFGVPAAIAGDWDSLTYQTSPVIMQVFYGQTIEPLLSAIEQVVNTKMLPLFDSTGLAEFGFDRDWIREHIADKQQVTTADKARQDLLEQRYKTGVLDLYDYMLMSGNPKASVEFVGWRWSEAAGAPVPPEEYTKIWQYKLPPVVAPPAPVLPPELPALSAPAPVAPLPDVTKDMGEPLFVGLSLANNADLIDLHRRVMAMHPDVPGDKWVSPEDYHATVLYAPAVDEETARGFLDAIREVDTPNFSLRIGQLNSFDNVAEHALHFRIRANTALREYQSNLFTIAKEYGIECSQHSDPATYTPHITLGYLPTKTPRLRYDGGIKVSPRGVWCDYGDKTLWKSWEPEPVPPDEPVKAYASEGIIKTPTMAITGDDAVLTTEMQRMSIRAELNAFAKFARKSASRPFVFNVTPPDIADWLTGDAVDAELPPGYAVRLAITACATETPDAVKTALVAGDWQALPDATRLYVEGIKAAGMNPADWLPIIEERYHSTTAAKALATTESRFKAEVERQMTRAYNEKVKKPAFKQQLQATIELYSSQIARDAIDDLKLELDLNDTEDEEAQAVLELIAQHIDTQRQYITAIADTLYADDAITLDEIAGKGDMWFRKSLYPVYADTMTLLGGNVRLEWVYGDADHCHSCITLNGIVLTAKRWQTEQIAPKSSELECNGFNCQCQFIVTKKKKWRGTLPNWRAVKAHEHGENVV